MVKLPKFYNKQSSICTFSYSDSQLDSFSFVGFTVEFEADFGLVLVQAAVVSLVPVAATAQGDVAEKGQTLPFLHLRVAAHSQDASVR